jgi:asparagine synthase (glutamine-hydrolysing)
MLTSDWCRNMCGISGFLDTTCQSNSLELEAAVTRMTDRIWRRGPDDSGAWVDPTAGVALGFRRLAIIDLSPTGHQPMASGDGRFVIVFNGEVYNFEELRRELLSLGHAFRGTSDTEVMLEAVCQWGLEAAVKRFNGMFAFALWDRRERRLHLVRDRLGIKPLYYGWMGPVFLFGSELKAMAAHPAFQGEIDRNALALYLRHNCVPGPYSIYQGIFKLLPASILTIDPAANPRSGAPQAYWSAREVVERGVSQPFTGTEREAADALDTLLRESVRLRMIADVPLGAFLSGGVDSSLIVALMQAQSTRPVKTFTIGFHEARFNEAEYARAVAAHLGTEHTELYVTPAEARAVIPSLPELYDEPFSDSSQIPTHLVAKLARQHVTVSLSGDGGDELFAGYNRYFWGRRLWRQVGWIPRPLRSAVGDFGRRISPATWDKWLSPSGYSELGEKSRKVFEILGARNPEDIYARLVGHWKKPEQVVIGSVEPPTLLSDRAAWSFLPDFTQSMMYYDLVTYLTDDILAKVDRACMGISLEARVPLLDDHRVVEFAWRLPLSMKLRDGKGKYLLRQVLYRYVPREMIERPKQGFSVPIDSWLRGPLRDWAEDLLNEDRLQREGFFNPQPIRQKWLAHLEGSRPDHYCLWDVLMFQAWLAANPQNGAHPAADQPAASEGNA